MKKNIIVNMSHKCSKIIRDTKNIPLSNLSKFLERVYNSA